MLENNAKGWHGCFSVIGRISAEKFQLILMKNDIINESRDKKKGDSVWFCSDYLGKKEKLKLEEKETDIFENTSNEKNETNPKNEKVENKYYKGYICGGNTKKIG